MNNSMLNSIFSDTQLWDNSELPVTINLSEIVAWNVEQIINLSYEEIVSMKDFLIQMYSEDKYEEILMKNIWNSKSVLSKEDFVQYHNIRNNFHLFFSPNFIGDIYRSQAFYHRYARENPVDEANLRINCDTPHKIKGSMDKIYKAYTTMIEYNEVHSNRDLFS